jgi:hypothetical protein
MLRIHLEIQLEMRPSKLASAFSSEIAMISLKGMRLPIAHKESVLKEQSR